MFTKNKTLLFLGAAIMAAALTVSAVSASVNSDPTKLVIHGSTTLGPVIDYVTATFNSAGQGVTIDTTNFVQNSSGAGIGDLNAAPTQLADIAMSSRALKSTESAVDTATIAGVDAVVIMVNDAHTPTDVTTLTKQQIRGIYENVYALTAAGGDGTHEYWDAGAVTVPAPGIVGDDGVPYDSGVAFPALPGHGISGDHVQIVVYARNLDSGTRGFLGDSIAHGGCVFATPQVTSADPVSVTNVYANYYPLEEQLMGITDANRFGSAQLMEDNISTSTAAAIGYAGVGYDTEAHIRKINVIDDISGSDRTAYAATPINIYSNHYHLSRYLYLVTKNGDSNLTNDNKFVQWFETLDSPGQDALTQKHELRIVPDQDINNTGTIGSADLTQLGVDYGKSDPSLTGTTHLRSDIDRVGSVGSAALTDLGYWYGVTVQALP
jgi:ABC-type phosphate transport system substrate-binding protein